MQLLVLGPAFGLPSIDGESIAAVVLLHERWAAEWSIVPTHHHPSSLPLLLDGDRRVSGFRNIANHLDDLLLRPDERGTTADASERADSTAAFSFLESNAQTLLDVSLYVSFENYRLATRPAFTRILPWHANYVIPPRLRAAARARTEHLGLASIDVDNVHEDMSNRPEGFDGVGKKDGFEPETQKRASLLLPRKETLRSLLQAPAHAAAFKLDALADSFFEPLQNMLGDKPYLLGPGVASVDYCAYGYLSLMLYPKVPQDWLASALRRKYRKLAAYTARMHAKFGVQTDVEDVMSLTESRTEGELADQRKARNISLPWTQPATSSVSDVIMATMQELTSHLPILGASATIIPSHPLRPTFWQKHLTILLGATATTLAVSTYYTFRTGILIWPRGEDVHIFGRKRLADYGHVGAALAGVSLLGHQASRNTSLRERDDRDNLAQVEIAVEGEGLP